MGRPVRSPLPLALTAALAGQEPTLHLPLDAEGPGWRGAVAIADGAVGGAARFDGRTAHIDCGPCPVSADAPFTLRCRLRTDHAGFCTPLMARDGDLVGLSLVLGRRPGHVSFEAWSWQGVRLLSRTRVDDGRWHDLEVGYDPATNTALLHVDGELQAVAELGPGAAATAQLRLGDNIGAHQPYRGDLDEVSVAPTGPPAERLAWAAPVLPRGERAAALAALRTGLLPAATPALEPLRLRDWPVRRLAVRAHVRDALGLDPWPERPPFDLQVHGSLERDGVVVERLSFRAFAGWRATGWLWRPATAPPGRRPAVLCPHGHWGDGARHPIVQARCAAFVRFGWTALAIDSTHAENVAAGASPLGTMTWHNLRALELLAAREDVDPARIAVTGCSGGGQQTFYLMALSDRPAAAAPVCMVSYFTEIVADTSAHCGCNHVPRLAHGTDVVEMCAVFAPRPAFVGSVTGDWTAHFPVQGLPELRRLWSELGAADRLASLHRDEGHDYSQPMREAVYGFLHAVFAAPGGGTPAAAAPLPEPAFAPWPPAELGALGGPPEAELASGPRAGAELQARRPPLADARELAPGLPWRAARQPVDWRGAADLPWRPASVRGPDGVPIPFAVRQRGPDAGGPDAGSDGPWTAFVDGAGKAVLVGRSPPWLAAPPRAAVIDPRGLGEWQPFAAAWRRNGLLLGRGELYQAAHDVALVCASLPGDGPVTLVGIGAAGPTAVVAATLSARVRKVVTDDLGPPYESDGNRTPLAPELLRHGLASFLRQLDGRCEYVLGGAVRDVSDIAGGPRRDLRAPISDAELLLELLPRAR